MYITTKVPLQVANIDSGGTIIVPERFETHRSVPLPFRSDQPFRYEKDDLFTPDEWNDRLLIGTMHLRSRKHMTLPRRRHGTVFLYSRKGRPYVYWQG